MARLLIVGCGCRGRLLARELIAAGHQVRGTTRDAGGVAAIELAGAEAVLADPDRVATLIGPLGQVSVVAILLGSASGTPSQLEALHGTRLEMLLTKLVDTTVRGVVYEVNGRVPEDLLAVGGQQVRAFAEDSRCGYELLDADPEDFTGWAAAASAAVQRVLGTM